MISTFCSSSSLRVQEQVHSTASVDYDVPVCLYRHTLHMNEKMLELLYSTCTSTVPGTGNVLYCTVVDHDDDDEESSSLYY